MANLLETALAMQDSVRSFMETALLGDNLGQSYLIMGSNPEGLVEAARAFAQGMVCACDGARPCGECGPCGMVERGTHPDVHVIEPAGTAGYLVEQVREVIDVVNLAPVMGARKVFILRDVHLMNASGANALLKSLEEPPADTVWILTAPNAQSLLPTIVSRAQVVMLRSVGFEDQVTALAHATGKPANICRRALGCCTSPMTAHAHMDDPRRASARSHALEALSHVWCESDWQTAKRVKPMLEAAKTPLEGLRQEQDAAIKASKDFLTDAGLKDLEKRHKRELASKERSGIMEQLRAMDSLLADALAISCGAASELVCDDYADAARAIADRLGTDGVLKALAKIRTGKERLRTTNSPSLAIEAMLLTLKES